MKEAVENVEQAAVEPVYEPTEDPSGGACAASSAQVVAGLIPKAARPWKRPRGTSVTVESGKSSTATFANTDISWTANGWLSESGTLSD